MDRGLAVLKRYAAPVDPAADLGAATPTLPEAIETARRQWEAANQFFDSVSDPELVDYAVYMVTAAERKYMYLLQEASRDKS